MRSFRGGSFKAAKKKGEIMSKVSNFSDLIQRVAASCLLHPLAAERYDSGDGARNRDADEVYEYETDENEEEEEEEEEEEDEGQSRVGYCRAKEVEPKETIMVEVFEAVAAMKKAYVRLQEAHCPWDAEKMRAADEAVVAEMRKIAVLRERWRRINVCGGGGGRGRGGMVMSSAATVREVVAPYEAAVEELRREVKARELEVENLKEKLKISAGGGTGGGKKGRSPSRKKVSCSQSQVAPSPSPELYEAAMSKVNDALRSFTSLLLSLMRSAHWDIGAAVRSIEAASMAADNPTASVGTITTTSSPITAQHAKYALESYVSRKVFQGFDHETFYMDGSLSSLLNPEQFRRDCFTQYRDMKAMDPSELLGILPTCHFGKFSSKKYLAVVHPKMEESLFGDLEQHRQVVAGNHPRSQFYGQFLELAKAVWLLHLLAFSLGPVPSLFEASRGAEFHPQYMESVVKFPGGRMPSSMVVGLPVSPGFKLWNGAVIKARVYLVSRS
ncbi:protein GRAVITROPIC IN THE LIGHT 1 [Morus notabilis]|uniref:protein GRAVITROPIC IN THE LIGHT 1 n=1 Tax=Morus notabilis TaxID=981085 RepID=UPI000CED50DD|nr:protein GRAVITROPIC IN THE LIGHT 1 [Morus notabilis]